MKEKSSKFLLSKMKFSTNLPFIKMIFPNRFASQVSFPTTEHSIEHFAKEFDDLHHLSVAAGGKSTSHLLGRAALCRKSRLLPEPFLDELAINQVF